MRLRVIDFETTGGDPEEVVEAAYVDVVGQSFRWEVDIPGWETLVRPDRKIEIPARAVHHLSDEDVVEGTAPQLMRARILGEPVTCAGPESEPPDYLVAHNVEFERALLKTDLPWICTLKAALRLWPDAPRHSNQVLRYWLDDCDPGEVGMPPHRALPDCRVTALILIRCLEQASVEDLARWTGEPRVLPTIPFGKHRGQRWEDVPRSYLQWILGQDFDEDVKWNARRACGKTT